jgi:hypothetical protein
MSPAIKNQVKLAGIALVAVMAFTAFGPGTALAVSPSERECEAQGGTFTREQGEVRCVIEEEETVGNAPEHSNAQRTTKEKTTTGQGNINNKQDEDIVCSGPPGQQDPECP